MPCWKSALIVAIFPLSDRWPQCLCVHKHVGLDSSVGRAPVRQSGGCRFKSRSRKFFFVYPNLSKICIQSVSLVAYYMIFIFKSRIFLWCIPYRLFPGCIVTWAWSLAKGQYMVAWLLTGAPEQRYWQNRETARYCSSVGRAPVRQYGGHRFKSRSSQFFFVYPNLSVHKHVKHVSLPLPHPLFLQVHLVFKPQKVTNMTYRKNIWI